jgi:hypothetical protein
MSDGRPISQEIRLPTNVEDVNKAIAKLDALIAQTHKLERAGESHRKKTTEGFRGIGRSIDEAKGKFREFSEFIGASLALEGLTKIAEKFADIGKEALTAAAHAQRMNFAIDAAAGGKERGENVRKWVEANAKHSEFSEATNESAYLGLKRYGVDNKSAGLFMKGAEDLAALAAPDQREAVYQEALSGLARVHARGKIDARSAMRLGIGVEDFKSLPQFKGMNGRQVSKALETSNVSENDLLNLIVKHAGEKGLGQRGFEASQLLETKMAKLGELPERFYKQLGEGEGAQRMTEALDALLARFDPSTEKGKKLTATMQSVFKEIASDIEPVTILIEKTIGAMEKLVHVAGAANDFLHKWTPLGFLEDKVSGSIENGAGVGEQQLGERMPKNFDYQAARARLHEERQIDSTKVDLYTGEAVSDGLATGIKRRAPAAVNAAGELGEDAEKATKDKLGIHSPSKVFQGLGEMTGEGFRVGLRSTDLGDLFDSTMQVRAPSFASIAMPARDGAPNLSVTVNVTASGGQDGAGLGQIIAQAVRREVTSLLERTGDEG